MGAFNTVWAEAACPTCGARQLFAVQFKYGDTWQIEYRIGDRLRWGGNDKGVRARKVVVEGFGGPCSECKGGGFEFDLLVEDNILRRVAALGLSRDDAMPEGYRVVEP
jgi:hypothetical protein